MLLWVLETSITTAQNDIATNKTDISTNKSSISNLESSVSDVFYAPGSYTVGTDAMRLVCAGELTSSGSDWEMTIPFPKMFKSNAKVAVTSLKGNGRIATGGYVDSQGYIGGGKEFITSDYSCTVTGILGNCICIILHNSNGFGYGGTSSKITNNTPVVMTVNYITVNVS